MKHAEKFGRPQSVTIEVSRWNVLITIETEDGQKQFVASADAWFTEHDSIWFGPKEEFDRELGIL